MRCFVTPNMISDEQLTLAQQALQAEHPGSVERKQNLTIGYFCGTRTHNADFRECSPALVRIMKAYPMVRLMLVGYLDVGREFAVFGRRVRRHRFVPWQRLSNLFTKIDINLAPLEPENPFTQCKSDLKYLEAAIMGIPTVASAVGAFTQSIDHGENGFLCRTEAEWFDCLSRLIEDAALRQRIGSLAKQMVHESRTVARGAEQLDKTLLESVRGYHRASREAAISGTDRDFTTADL